MPGMLIRRYRICDAETLGDEITQIYRIFTDLRYPEWFIHDARISQGLHFSTEAKERKMVCENVKNVTFSSTINIQ